MDRCQHCILSVSVHGRDGHCIDKIKLKSAMDETTRTKWTQRDEEIADAGDSKILHSSKSHEEKTLEDKTNTGTDTRTRKPCKMTMSYLMDPMLASCLTIELQRSACFRKSFMMLLDRNCRNRFWNVKCRKDVVAESSNSCVRYKVFLKLTKVHLFRMDPDIQWSNRMLPWWMIRLLLEDAFSWLSTLGGAYSSLGENFSQCAIEAGRLSLRQLKLAVRLGDPLLQARCFVYMALSLMQRGFLKQARDIIRHQYKFAISMGEQADTRLIAMCRGVWSHLGYHYQQRREMRKDRRHRSKSGGGRTHQNGTKNIGINHAVLGNVVS